MPNRPGAILAVAILLSGLLSVGRAHAADVDGDGIDDAQEDTLLQTYAPELFFHPDERYFPTTVAFDLDQSVLERYNATASVLVDANPTAASIAAYNTPVDASTNPEGVYFLNDTLGDTRDDSGILGAYRAGAYPNVVYGHVTPDSGQTVVQYWFHYA
ncbi:MAG TPA: Vps62-related protein, partial [Thermoplasmata archaeon]|nr:Vps62-related protein [Thermoplasmata archaeon]